MLFGKHKRNEKKLDAWIAAYALNLCTTSITQIIENNDLRYMEQEYENILNNLNLEVMPKDEALLDVLKQILDVINFFKIQSKEKVLLDKEYQQKLKDAVWSAVPSPSVILADGKSGWVGLAVSAAVSVGTGYMNYRKQKSRINNEQERKNWELERSAIEQLHGLKRQLFETAWRLADEYKFDDKYRLSERQIKQYEAILSDKFPLRRYERLEYIQDNFEAYPPFWYYMGAAALEFANYSASDIKINIDYLKRSRKCFKKFLDKSSAGLRVLREDPIVAQCTFEYLAVLNLLEEKGVLSSEKLVQLKQEKIKLLKDARDSSGNACDILQQCALNYMALGSDDEAIKIMVALINERYNVSTNAQFLSLLYTQKRLNGDAMAGNQYFLLQNKPIGDAILYPMISSETEKTQADNEFAFKLKISSAQKYKKAIEKYASDMRELFLELWNADYDIAEDVIDLLNRMVKDMSNMVTEKISEIIWFLLSFFLALSGPGSSRHSA